MPPTSTRRLLGTVVDIEGFVITIETDAAMYIAVDLEDCHPCVEDAGRPAGSS
jgi:hypothetical protein